MEERGKSFLGNLRDWVTGISWLAGVLVTIVLLLANIDGIKGLGLGWQIAFGVGIALAWVVIIWFFLPVVIHWRSKHSPERTPAPLEPFPSSFTLSNPTIKLPGFRFYPSRELLQSDRPAKKLLESTSHIWGFWNTGTQISDIDGPKLGHIKRMILPDPEGKWFGHLVEIAGRPEDYLAKLIVTLTEQAREYNTPVKWFPGFALSTLMINPNAVDGWAQVEILVAKKTVAERPSFVVSSKEFPELYQAIKQSYEDVWEHNAKEPTKEQIERIRNAGKSKVGLVFS